MLGQLFPRHECAKRKISTNNNLSFKSSKLKRKSLLGQKKKEKTSREWKRRAQTIQDPDLRYFDLWREGTPGCSEIHLQEHPLGGRRHRRKCQSILISLSLLQGRWCQYYLNTHRWYITYLEHCLQISPRTPFSQETLSSATNCVLMSPMPVYFYDEKTAKPQVSRSSLQCLSWLHY